MFLYISRTQISTLKPKSNSPETDLVFPHFNSTSTETMSVEVLDGATIRAFVEDDLAFNVSVDDRFASLDVDRDGLLSFAEMMKELRSLRVRETHFSIDEGESSPDEIAVIHRSLFAKFDNDRNGAVDLEEFRAETKEMMMAMARGLGFLPVQMVLEEGSFLKKAVERELTVLAASS